ncbi:MAG: hypothetical protein HUU19_01570 [Phycisphaerales bacterium]|nr:hypothetical protein [Phycisphaerales bacterium]
MRNFVLLKIDLTDEFKPVTENRLIATFTLVASGKNTEDAFLTDGKGAEVELPLGTRFEFERVDLSELLVKGKTGEVLFVVGHTSG